MILRVFLNGEFDSAVSADLRELAEKLADNGIGAKMSTVSVPGVKAELIVGLAIASLTVSSISTLITVINFWRSQKKATYRLTLDTGTGTSNLDEATQEALKEAVQAGRPVSLFVEKL